jgi:hypothetical protein
MTSRAITMDHETTTETEITTGGEITMWREITMGTEIMMGGEIMMRRSQQTAAMQRGWMPSKLDGTGRRV